MSFLDLSTPIVIAHRGASAYAPENTLAAFELAVRQGAPAIELDAKLSKDKQVMVIHDQTVNRTTRHSGKVSALTLAEMKKMDAGSHFDLAFRGEPIPTLDEVFAAIGPHACINVELTNYLSVTDELPEKVAGLVQRHNLQERVLFSSFNPIALRRIQRLLPGTPVGLLAYGGLPGLLARSWPGRLLAYQNLHPAHQDVTPRLLQSAHRRGHKIIAYTVNQAEDMRRLFALGVDGIFTDDPMLALNILRSKQAAP